MAKMTRRESRVCALELLFDYNFNRESTPKERMDIAREDRQADISDFAETLFTTAAEHLDDIDARISARGENWSFERMSVLAKTVMRICVCEVLYLDTPGEIAVNEAIEIMKMYDDEKACRFVNGVLGGVIKDIDEKSE